MPTSDGDQPVSTGANQVQDATPRCWPLVKADLGHNAGVSRAAAGPDDGLPRTRRPGWGGGEQRRRRKSAVAQVFTRRQASGAAQVDRVLADGCSPQASCVATACRIPAFLFRRRRLELASNGLVLFDAVLITRRRQDVCGAAAYAGPVVNPPLGIDDRPALPLLVPPARRRPSGARRLRHRPGAAHPAAF